jgi:hypothetical protein
MGGVEVYDGSGPARPFLVIRAVCVRASAGLVIHQARDSLQVVQMVRRWREDIVAKWCHTVLRLA